MLMAVIPVASLRLNSAFTIIIFCKFITLQYCCSLLTIITFQLRSIDMMIIENSVFVLVSTGMR